MTSEEAPMYRKKYLCLFPDAKCKGYPKLEPVVWYSRKTGEKKKKEDCGRGQKELVKGGK